MRYTEGKLGRVFVLKFDDQDILLDELKAFAHQAKVRTAVCLFLGALRQGRVVTGPQRPVIPPQPNWKSFRDGWEVMGIGTIFPNDEGPQIHLHTSMGKKDSVITGCLREKPNVFLVLEAVVFELNGVKADKNLDPETGLNLLRILGV